MVGGGATTFLLTRIHRQQQTPPQTPLGLGSRTEPCNYSLISPSTSEAWPCGGSGSRAAGAPGTTGQRGGTAVGTSRPGAATRRPPSSAAPARSLGTLLFQEDLLLPVPPPPHGSSALTASPPLASHRPHEHCPRLEAGASGLSPEAETQSPRPPWGRCSHRSPDGCPQPVPVLI